ncbi:MAG: damage-inducible protein DinB [Proteobacteria bacterium]|nr:damage-inducible protein DinB [Pseudomonadota bacterium]
MPTPAYFHTLARYNAWANRRLYAACGKLPHEEYVKDRSAFFGSIHGTLNHILVGDRIWLGRIEGSTAPAPALDAILYPDFARLLVAREREDNRILKLTGGLTEARLAGELDYANTQGERFRMPMSLVLGHLFNHQTHHRGQVHDMLSQVPSEPPPLDLAYFTRSREFAGTAC